MLRFGEAVRPVVHRAVLREARADLGETQCDHELEHRGRQETPGER